MSSQWRRSSSPLAALAFLFLVPPGEAQEGVLAGSVVAEAMAVPLASVIVEVVDGEGIRVSQIRTGPPGTFRVEGLAPGTYTVQFRLPGWAPVVRDGLELRPGEIVHVSASLAPEPFTLNPITVTAARNEQKLLDAPTSVSHVDRRTLEEPALTPVDHVATFAGVDIVRVGLQQAYVAVRGFNGVLSGRLLTLVDHRTAQLPALRSNLLHGLPTTSLDMERIEIVRGAGAALYGPNAADGVLHILTRSPLEGSGGDLAMGFGLRQQAAGEGFDESDRPLFRTEGRVAHRLAPNLGVKVSGSYMRGTDFRFLDPEEEAARGLAQQCLGDPSAPPCQAYPPDLSSEELSRIGQRDFRAESYSLDARADWRRGPEATAVFASGMSKGVSSIELSGSGATQAAGWVSSYAQVRYSAPRLFGQLFFNRSHSGDSYFLRTGRHLRDDSWLLAGQLQHRSDLRDRHRLVYGMDLIRTTPVTHGTLNGIFEDEDESTEIGAYLQSQSRLGAGWDGVLAFRADYHSVLERVILSPRAAVLFQPREGHTLRATFNRAFWTPDNIDFYFDVTAQRIPLGGPLAYLVQVMGTGRDGFRFERIDGRPAMRSPFADLPTLPNLPGLPADISSADFIETTTERLWQLALAAVIAQNPEVGPLLSSLPVPGEGEVGVALLLPAGEAGLEPLPGGFSGLQDIPPLREEVTNTFEIGYKGLLAGRLLVGVDAYYTRKENVIGPPRPESPFAFLDGASLHAYLIPRLAPAVGPEAAAAIAGAMASIPLGVVSPPVGAEADRPPSLLITRRNYRSLDLFGLDLSGAAELSPTLTLALAASWVSDDDFDAGGARIALNASRLKGAVSLRYRDDERGLSLRASQRYTRGFPVQSGVYSGFVGSYGVTDVGLGFRLPRPRPVRVELDIQNAANRSYRGFVGAPALGRMILGRLRYEF